jgi:hypothetical protein
MTEVGIEDHDLEDYVVDSGCIEDKVDILTFIVQDSISILIFEITF